MEDVASLFEEKVEEDVSNEGGFCGEDNDLEGFPRNMSYASLFLLSLERSTTCGWKGRVFC